MKNSWSKKKMLAGWMAAQDRVRHFLNEVRFHLVNALQRASV